MSEKLSITLPADMVRLIKEQVSSGAYASTSEVLRAAMRTWMRDEEEHQERIKAIRGRVQASIDDPRPSLTVDEVFDDLETLYESKATAAE